MGDLRQIPKETLCCVFNCGDRGTVLGKVSLGAKQFWVYWYVIRMNLRSVIVMEDDPIFQVPFKLAIGELVSALPDSFTMAMFSGCMGKHIFSVRSNFGHHFYACKTRGDCLDAKEGPDMKPTKAYRNLSDGCKSPPEEAHYRPWYAVEAEERNSSNIAGYCRQMFGPGLSHRCGSGYIVSPLGAQIMLEHYYHKPAGGIHLIADHAIHAAGGLRPGMYWTEPYFTRQHNLPKRTYSGRTAESKMTLETLANNSRIDERPLWLPQQNMTLATTQPCWW